MQRPAGRMMVTGVVAVAALAVAVSIAVASRWSVDGRGLGQFPAGEHELHDVVLLREPTSSTVERLGLPERLAGAVIPGAEALVLVGAVSSSGMFGCESVRVTDVQLDDGVLTVDTAYSRFRVSCNDDAIPSVLALALSTEVVAATDVIIVEREGYMVAYRTTAQAEAAPQPPD